MVYEDKYTNETLKLSREYGDIVRDFLEFYEEQICRGQMVFLSDNVSSFLDSSMGIVENLEHDKHLFCSSLDNCFYRHTTTYYTKLRSQNSLVFFTVFSDDFTASVLLSIRLDNVSPSTIRKC